ncbi:MAG: NYN domain-containing protein [Thermicanus sp.]|nr:NYN domain-containing protein [Thermicanus sp.]
MEEILIVDGYNIIGAWPKLRQLKESGHLEEARGQLLEILAEYQSFTGRKVIVVFDAHQVYGREKSLRYHQIDVYFTGEKETADEWIERYVKTKKSRRNQLFVATSDETEQRVIFGVGALRISARELFKEIERGKEKIREQMEKGRERPVPGRNVAERLHPDLVKFLEKYRRK